jgi:hypothetical protein
MSVATFLLLFVVSVPLLGVAWTIALMGRGWRDASALFAVTVGATCVLWPFIWPLLTSDLFALSEMGPALLLLVLLLAVALFAVYHEMRWGWWLLAGSPFVAVAVCGAVTWVWEAL